MKALIKIMLMVATVFASTFIIMKFTGVLSIEKIEMWLQWAQSLSLVYVGSLIVLLLFLDLFIAMPTMTLSMLAGFFLGPIWGSFAAISGMMLAGIVGYWLCAHFGDGVFIRIVKDSNEREQAKESFIEHGVIMILLSRAVPILPEVTACLAGLTGMRFRKFLLFWSISTVPYCLIAVYAGSISTLDNPKPAIITAALLTGTLWLGWFLFNRITKRKKRGLVG